MLLTVALARKAPGTALAVVWLVGAFQVAYGVNILLVQLSVAYVAFAVARWGSHGRVAQRHSRCPCRR